MAKRPAPARPAARGLNFNFRVSPGEKAAIQRAADHEDRRPSALARKIVLDWLRSRRWLEKGQGNG